MFDCAFIQEVGGGQLRPEETLVIDYLEGIGLAYTFYTSKRIRRRQLPLTSTSLVVGDMDCTYGAMKQLGIRQPPADSYPRVLEQYFHRKTWKSDLGTVLRSFESGGSAPVFVKPADRQKVFTGRCVTNESDLYWLQRVSRRQPVVCSELVRWVTEYRAYVCKGEVVAVSHYDGDEAIKLDYEIVQAAVQSLGRADDCPDGYGLDFGILQSGETALVEMNDGFSLGAYDIDSVSYARVLLARWEQLARQLQGTSRHS